MSIKPAAAHTPSLMARIGLRSRAGGNRRSIDVAQGRCSVAPNGTGMAFDPRKISILEVAGVTTIILSAVALASVLYSIW